MPEQDEESGPADRRAPGFRVWPPLAIGIPWLLAFWWDRSRAPQESFGPVATAAGWLLLAAFVGWNGWCLWLFARHRTGLLPGQQTAELLDEGPYRLSRNPLYVGLLAAYVGAGLVVSSVPVLLATPVAWVLLHWGAVLPEERYLRERLGASYADYCSRVPRWLGPAPAGRARRPLA